MKCFAEQARELKASQEAAVAAKQAAEDAAKEKQRRINTDGPAAAQQLAAEVIADIKRQVIEAGQAVYFVCRNSHSVALRLKLL